MCVDLDVGAESGDFHQFGELVGAELVVVDLGIHVDGFLVVVEDDLTFEKAPGGTSKLDPVNSSTHRDQLADVV